MDMYSEERCYCKSWKDCTHDVYTTRCHDAPDPIITERDNEMDVFRTSTRVGSIADRFPYVVQDGSVILASSDLKNAYCHIGFLDNEAHDWLISAPDFTLVYLLDCDAHLKGWAKGKFNVMDEVVSTFPDYEI